MLFRSHANGGLLLRDLRLPDFRKYGIDVPAPGAVEAQDMIELGGFVRDIFKLNEESRNFRIFGPDETSRHLPLSGSYGSGRKQGG